VQPWGIPERAQNCKAQSPAFAASDVSLLIKLMLKSACWSKSLTVKAVPLKPDAVMLVTIARCLILPLLFDPESAAMIKDNKTDRP